MSHTFPHTSRRGFLAMSASLLGGGNLKWAPAGANIVIEMPDVPADSAKTQYAYTIRLHGIR